MRAYATLGDVLVKSRVFSFLNLPVAALTLNRKLSLPVSRMWQWWVRRSSSAVVILGSPNTPAHSLKLWTCPGKVESSLEMKGELDDEAEAFYERV